MDCWPLLERAIPTEDDGEVLTLAVEVPAVGYAILAWAAKEAERVLLYSGNPRAYPESGRGVLLCALGVLEGYYRPAAGGL